MSGTNILSSGEEVGDAGGDALLLAIAIPVDDTTISSHSSKDSSEILTLFLRPFCPSDDLLASGARGGCGGDNGDAPRCNVCFTNEDPLPRELCRNEESLLLAAGGGSLCRYETVECDR